MAMNLNKQQQELNSRLERIKELSYRVFAQTELGKELLEKLKEYFHGAPCAVPGQIEGFGYWREGQNELIRQLEIFARAFAQEQTAKSEESQGVAYERSPTGV